MYQNFGSLKEKFKILPQFCLLWTEFKIIYSNSVPSSTEIFQVFISSLNINVTINNIKDAINNHESIITLSKHSYSVWVPFYILNHFYIFKSYQLHVCQTNTQIAFFKNAFPCWETFRETNMKKNFPFIEITLRN